MHISSTFLKHSLGVFRGHRKPVLFVGFFSGWAVFSLQLVYLWQIATCSWQQTFTLSSGGVATLCFAHLRWGTRKNDVKTSFTAVLSVLCRGPSSQDMGTSEGSMCVCVCVHEQDLCCLAWTLALSSWQSDVLRQHYNHKY